MLLQDLFLLGEGVFDLHQLEEQFLILGVVKLMIFGLGVMDTCELIHCLLLECLRQSVELISIFSIHLIEASICQFLTIHLLLQLRITYLQTLSQFFYVSFKSFF